MNKLLFRTHAIQRMAQRNISKEDVCNVVNTGRTILRYPDDKPFASRLILGYSNERPLHVLLAEDFASATNFVITVYEPHPDKWNEQFEERRRS